jgi:hypothetical protein
MFFNRQLFFSFDRIAYHFLNNAYLIAKTPCITNEISKKFQ